MGFLISFCLISLEERTRLGAAAANRQAFMTVHLEGFRAMFARIVQLKYIGKCGAGRHLEARLR